MEAISARFAPFPPRRFFISARPSAWKWITENSQNVPCTCKDQDFKLYRFCRINNTLHLYPIWFVTDCDPSRLAISKVVDPLCHGESKIRILITSWTPEPQMQLHRTPWRTCLCKLTPRKTVSLTLTRKDTSQRTDDALISYESCYMMDQMTCWSTAASAARGCLPLLFGIWILLSHKAANLPVEVPCSWAILEIS